jgi:hypothetical protein
MYVNTSDHENNVITVNIVSPIIKIFRDFE